MKYVVVRLTEGGIEVPVLFAPTVRHAEVARGFLAAGCSVLSAGFVEVDDHRRCHVSDEVSLSLGSMRPRTARDQLMIQLALDAPT